MTDRPELVIDGDGHVIEVNETYERIDPGYRHRRPVYTQTSRGNVVRLIDGKVCTSTPCSSASRVVTAGPIPARSPR